MFAIELLAKAVRDAATAEALHHDRAFLRDLEDGKDVTRLFEVTTVAPAGEGRRAIPRSWKFRIPLRAVRERPVL